MTVNQRSRSKIFQPPVVVRRARGADRAALVRLSCALWPDDDTPAGHDRHVRAVLGGRPPSTLPLVMFVATAGRRAVGFVEVGLRSHANGCDPGRAVGFLEGWYVEPRWRRRGVGGALVAAAEAWCRARGCREMASDTWLDERRSIAAHRALGYEVEGRYVNFRKALR
jgi:aminoglycoside 6'-N-acetyltransferase I